jgi:hypothetical protein
VVYCPSVVLYRGHHPEEVAKFIHQVVLFFVGRPPLKYQLTERKTVVQDLKGGVCVADVRVLHAH